MKTQTTTVAVLGTGAIGTAIAKTLRAHDHAVHVWNRSRERTAEAAASGAAVHDDAADAARGAGLVLVTVTDYDAVDAILAGLEPGEDATLAVLTTGTPEQATAAAQRARALGYAYLDAGVQTSPEDIGTPTATVLLAGDEAAFAAHRPVLERLATVHFVSTEPEAAALWDLALFGVWYDAQIGLLRALDVVAEHGIAPEAFAQTARVQLGHAADAAVATAREQVTGEHPRGPADLREHLPVLERLAALHAGRRLGDGGATATVARTRALIDAGHGERGLTALLRDV